MTRTAVWAVLATTALARADVTFSDGTFTLADWQLVPFTNGAAGAYAAIQQPAGGNPGAFRRIDITINAVNSFRSSQIWGVQFKAGALYDPRADGAITSIDYSEDAIYLGGGGDGDGQGTGLAIRQSKTVYVAATVTGRQTSWKHVALAGLKPADFGMLTGDERFYIASAHPDFSATAAPMELGFWRGNTVRRDPHRAPRYIGQRSEQRTGWRSGFNSRGRVLRGERTIKPGRPSTAAI